MASELIQIFYHEDHLKELYPFATPYDNRGKLTVFFESTPIVKFVMETKCDKVAVCSWQLRAKQRGYYVGRPKPITQEVLEGNFDILALTKNTKYHTMLAQGAQAHEYFQPTFNKIVEAIGKRSPGEVKNPIYQNHHCTRTDIYQDYVKNWLLPAMEAMENDKEIKELCFRDAKYSMATPLGLANVKKELGLDYYPHHPFLLERLFSVYHNVMKIKVTYNDENIPATSK